MIRIIVRECDGQFITPHGGTHANRYRTFVVDNAALEACLRQRGTETLAEVVGAEVFEGPSGTFPKSDLHHVAAYLDPAGTAPPLDPDAAQRVGKLLRVLAGNSP